MPVAAAAAVTAFHTTAAPVGPVVVARVATREAMARPERLIGVGVAVVRRMDKPPVLAVQAS